MSRSGQGLLQIGKGVFDGTIGIAENRRVRAVGVPCSGCSGCRGCRGCRGCEGSGWVGVDGCSGSQLLSTDTAFLGSAHAALTLGDGVGQAVISSTAPLAKAGKMMRKLVPWHCGRKAVDYDAQGQGAGGGYGGGYGGGGVGVPGTTALSSSPSPEGKKRT